MDLFYFDIRWLYNCLDNTDFNMFRWLLWKKFPKTCWTSEKGVEFIGCEGVLDVRQIQRETNKLLPICKMVLNYHKRIKWFILSLEFIPISEIRGFTIFLLYLPES
jgi:hypothetical protein